LEFSGIAAVLAKFASDYMNSNGIAWSQAKVHKMAIRAAALQDTSLASKFLSPDKLHDAMVNVLKRFEAAGLARAGIPPSSETLQ
jgi:hypothetical protein